jgi:hypothetical protein
MQRLQSVHLSCTVNLGGFIISSFGKNVLKHCYYFVNTEFRGNLHRIHSRLVVDYHLISSGYDFDEDLTLG